MKRIVSVVLSVIMLVTVFTSCTGGSSPTPAPSTPTPAASTPAPATATPAPTTAAVTEPDPPARERITVTFATGTMTDINDEIGKWIMDLFDIDFVPVLVEGTDMLALMGATGDLPDMFGMQTFEDKNFYQWVEQGIIREIPRNLIDKYYHIQRVVDMSREGAIVRDFLGGRQMYLPRPSDVDPINISETSRLFFRKDWAENLGIDPPTTTDEFFEMMRAFTEDDPDGNGVNDTVGLLSAGNWFMSMMITMFSGVAIDGWVYENGEYIPGYYSERMIPGLEYLREMYSRGYIDPEYSVTGATASMEKFGQDVGGALFRNGGDPYWLMRTSRYYRDAHPSTNTEINVWRNHFGMLYPLLAPGNDRTYWVPRTEPGGTCFNANVSDEKLDRMLEWINWSEEPEQVEMGRYGVEGRTYAKGADGSIALFIDPSTGDYYQIWIEFPGLALIPRTHGDFRQQFNVEIPSTTHVDFRRDSLAINEKYDESVIDEGHAMILRFVTTPEMDDLLNYVDEGSAYAQIIMGREPVAEMFAKFRAECDAVGARAAIDSATALMRSYGY